MLILTRNPGQTFFIRTPTGDNLTITCLGVNKRSGQVRIGINAPKEYNIVREELIGRDEASLDGQSRPPRVLSSPDDW